MQIIKLSATDSTNAYLKNLHLQQELADFTVVQAHTQLAGRGQMGTKWVAEPGKNLTISVLKKHGCLDAKDQFGITMVASLGIYKGLKALLIPDLKIKWPNDILSGTSKICGILIENLTKGSKIQSSVVGIGLNVNQLDFGSLQQVSSLQRILGYPLDLEEVLSVILNELCTAFGQLEGNSKGLLKGAYEDLLFRKDKPSTFSNKDGEPFTGIIRGVSGEGKLQVALEDNNLQEFDLKEIQLLY